MVLVRKGIKIPLVLTGNNEKISYTVNNCYNAAGDILPPFVVYKAQNRLFDKWGVGGPEKTVYTTSMSGWMEEMQFQQWMENILIPNIKKYEIDHVLILDGHVTHVNLKVIELCKNNNIHLICLPAHSSTVLQPLDVGVYCHVKRVWCAVLKKFYTETRCSNVDKFTFPLLLARLYTSDDAFRRSHAIYGFKLTGLFPLNQQNINKYKLKLAQTFNTPATTTSQLPSTTTIASQLTPTPTIRDLIDLQ